MRLILVCLLFIVNHSHAAILQLCPASQAEQGVYSATVTQANGEQWRLLVSESPLPGCQSLELPVSVDAIAAIHPFSNDMAASLGDTVLVHGSERDGRFSVSTISSTAPKSGPGRSAMPIRENLLHGMSIRTFGVEERIQAQLNDGHLHLQCKAGSRPAGVILSAPWVMSEARADLAVAAKGSGRYELQVQDASAAAGGTALTLGHLSAAGGDALAFSLPRSGFNRAGWQAFSIACPQEKAELHVSSMQLQPRAGQVPARSAWIWNPADWQQRTDAVLAHARAHGIKVVFISVPVSGGAVAHPELLARFIREAARDNVEVWSIDGDPRMVLPGEQRAAAARVRAYVAYNRATAADARLRGMQFDVEHYLLPGYELSSADLDRRYIELARALHGAAAGLPLEFVVPFWWADKAELLNAVVPFAAGLTVMDYRTDPRQIIGFGTPFLDWASRHRKRVRIALEAGPIEAEVQRRYSKSSSGELWLLKLAQIPVLVLLKQVQEPPAGSAYRLSASRVIDGSATTFHKNPERMLGLLPELEADFSAWQGFGGIALHELKLPAVR